MKGNWSGYFCVTKSRCRVSDKWLGLRFLMSDEDRKVFVIAGYIHFLTCFSLTWHMSALTLPSFPLSPLFLSRRYLASVHPLLFICTPSSSLYFLLFLHLFISCTYYLHSLQGRSGAFYMPGISNAENFTFYSILGK